MRARTTPTIVARLPVAGVDPRSLELRPVAWAGVFLVALVLIATLVRPVAAGPAAPDAAASVLYFDRIVSGERLEAFVNTTPKPLLTVAYGVARLVTGDWRAVSGLAILAAALAVAAGAALFSRVTGPVAGVLAAAFLATGSALLVEVSWAYGLPWALACWLGSGLALTARVPRYGLAGLLLMLGALVRQETFILIALATAVLAFLALLRRPPSGAWRLMVAWAALPLMLVHDWLLAGDPLYWLHVSSVYAEQARARSVTRVVREIAGVFTGSPLLTAAALVGAAAMTRSRAGLVVLIGLVGIAAGTAALLLAVAAMDRQVLSHYYTPIGVALGLAACAGVARIVDVLADGWQRWWTRRRGTVRPAAAPRDAGEGDRTMGTVRRPSVSLPQLAVMIALALVIGYPIASRSLLSPATLRNLARQRHIAERSDAASSTIRSLLGATSPSGRAVGPTTRAEPSGFSILVPGVDRSRMAVDLGLPVTAIGPLDTPTSRGVIHPGLIVYHDRIADPTSAITTRFEGEPPLTVEGVTFELVSRDPPDSWIWRSAN